MALTDGQGRIHDYMRISITDRCNLRCFYCMGSDGVEQISHSDILRYEEILKVVEAAAELGISKIRITGGEPLVRRGITALIGKIAAVPGINDLAMTTNGVLLARFAAGLKQAGLNRVNISLDTLKPELFRHITRCGELERALEGIDAALKHDLQPVKLNVVLMKGINETEVPAFLRLVREKPLHVRFIEYMPIGDHDREYRERYLPLSFVAETARKADLPLTPVPLPGGAGPAESYTIPGGRGTVGLIHPISKHFCSSCNRLRLTAEGCLKACLYWQEEQPVRPVIDDKEALKALIREVLAGKPAEHRMAADSGCGSISRAKMRGMSSTGG